MEKTEDIRKVVNYIEDHLSEKLNLEEIAGMAGYSKYHFNRLFAKRVGCTIYQYVQKRRLTEAANKLVRSQSTIVIIAFEARYNSQQAFSFAFRQLYHVSPQLFRENGIFYPQQERFISDIKMLDLNINKKCEVMAA